MLRTSTERCAPRGNRRLRFVPMALLTASVILTTPSIRAQDDLHVQYKFNGLADGALPAGNLLADGYSHVLGVASSGGKSCTPFPGCGVVFDWAHGYLVPKYTFGSLGGLYNFPTSGLARDAAGNLYGDMQIQYKLNVDVGVIYKISPSGKGELVHTFPTEEGLPYGGLTLDAEGNLYGMANEEIFKITPKGVESVLFRFDNPTVTGSTPSSLAIDADGSFYGTTAYGGPGGNGGSTGLGNGVLFKLSPEGTFTTLHYFTGGAGGALPNSLALDGNGNIYGFTEDGGDLATCAKYDGGAFSNGGCGLAYKYDKYGNFSVIHSFTGFDGARPQGIPLILSDTVYGATSAGGVFGATEGLDGYGVVFQITANGTETTLHSFTGKDGLEPSTGLIQLPNGDIYGATAFGGHSSLSTNPCKTSGTAGCGVLYKIVLPM